MNNLDDLMEVWRSQDAAPLHGVNETLLRLALRQDEAKLRRASWIVYVVSAFAIVLTAFLLVVLIFDQDRHTAWNFALPIVGAAAALLWGSALYMSHRAQVLLERSFGESLRDRLRRHIAQLDYQATKVDRLARELGIAVTICSTAIILFLAAWRLNGKPFNAEWVGIARGIFVCVWSVAAAVWLVRRWVQRNVLPRKHRLEALLKELDGQ